MLVSNQATQAEPEPRLSPGEFSIVDNYEEDSGNRPSVKVATESDRWKVEFRGSTDKNWHPQFCRDDCRFSISKTHVADFLPTQNLPDTVTGDCLSSDPVLFCAYEVEVEGNV